jgi:hypothetical protein
VADYGCILCVAHGATTSGCAVALQEGLPPDQKLGGKKDVCSFAVFVPCDPANLTGPWYAPKQLWENVLDEGGQQSEADNGL